MRMKPILRPLAVAVMASAILLAPYAARADDNWTGFGVLKSGKGYATTPMGEVHYRDLGPRDAKVTVLLLHMTPLSMIQFGEVQPELARLGIRSIAVDTPGYGMSDPPAKAQPEISDFADNLVPVLDQLGVHKVIVAGHHTGASIATSFAVRHPDRVSAIVLHGVPVFTVEEMAERAKIPTIDRTPKVDGTHLSRYFHPPAPGTLAPSAAFLAAHTWFTISMFIEGRDVGHYAVYHYNMEPDLKALKVPGLILSDTGEDIHVIDLRAAKMRPDFAYKDFSDESGGLSIMVHPKEWSKTIADFAATAVK